MRPRPLPLGAIANERRGLERRGLDRRAPGLRTAFSLQGARARGAISWQTMLADLALILFMVTAAAMGQPAKTPAAKTPATKPAPKPAPLALPWSARGEALAIWRAGAGAPSLGAWLGAQAADQRQQLTISAAYQPGQFAKAAARAAALAAQAGAMGRKARLVIEPADSTAHVPGGVDISASLAFDRPDPGAAPRPAARPAPTTPGLARGLQDNVRINPS